ncbi:MAG: aminopeptidase P N-terminal domain-containing protein, partial [Phycisphaerales bacterium]
MSPRPVSLKTPEIPVAEFAQRREKVNKALKNRIGMVFAGPSDAALHGAYRPHPHFEYLTGITDEPGAMLLLDPTAPANRQATLFLKPLDPEVEKWDGLRDEIGTPLRQRYGI